MYKYRTDANQAKIINECRESGFHVKTLGNGVIDTYMFREDVPIIFLTEIKTGKQENAHKKLSAEQKKFFGHFGGAANLMLATNTDYIIQYTNLFKESYIKGEYK